jgi:hypothetical protein
MNGAGKYKLELLLLILVIAFLLLITLSSSDPLVDLIFKLALIADVVAFFYTLLALWRSKWRGAVAKVAQKAFVRMARAFMRVLEAVGARKKNRNILSGETQVTFSVERAEKQKKVSGRSKKWKHLESSRDRMRYLYRYSVRDRIKRGERIYAADTPSELRSREETSERDEALLGLYVTYRYDDRHEPSEDEITSLKENYFENVK